MKSAKIEMQDDGDRGRGTWTFELRASELERQCKTWAEYHRKHEAHWKEQVGELELKRRESATISEQPMTGGVQQVLHYDPGVDREYQTAVQKRDQHRSRAEDMEQWATCFGLPADVDRRFDLTPGDVSFFRVGQSPPDDLPGADA